MEKFNDILGETIYLDRDQCKDFGIKYAKGTEDFVCSAEALLKSKGQGYDKKHIALLKPLGGSSIVAKPTGYGWFEITRIIPSMF